MGRINLFPVQREYQYFLKEEIFLQLFNKGEASKNLLVDAAEYKIEEYEKQSHARGGSNTNVEGGVVREDPLLVVAWKLVKTGTSNCRLDGQVPSTQLVAHHWKRHISTLLRDVVMMMIVTPPGRHTTHTTLSSFTGYTGPLLPATHLPAHYHATQTLDMDSGKFLYI